MNTGIAGGATAPATRNFSSFSNEQLANWFTYHSPTAEQQVAYMRIRTAARVVADVINENVPAGADKSAAMRLLREAVMTANAGVACGPLEASDIAKIRTEEPPALDEAQRKDLARRLDEAIGTVEGGVRAGGMVETSAGPA